MTLAVAFFGLFLVFCRVGACIMFMPAFSSLRVPMRARLLIALGVSLVLSPIAPSQHVERLLAEGPPVQMVAIGAECLIGSVIGLVARLFFLMLEMMTVAMSNAVGLSVAFAPPIEGDQSTPTIASLIGLVAIVVFFVSGLHGEVLRALLKSYDLAPPLQLPEFRHLLADLVDATAAASFLCLQLAGPIFIVSVLVNVAFGLLNRMVPQAPIYFISAPFVIAAGLLVLFSAEKPMLGLYADGLGRWLDRY